MFPNRKIHAIDVYASNRGLKKDKNFLFSKGRKGDLRVLLDEKYESYYWIGFIFADGYIHHKSNHLIIFIDQLDKDHLQKYADYVNGKVMTYTSTKKFSELSEPYESVMCRVAVAQKQIVPKIIDKFGFKPAKTYNPPDIITLHQTLNTKEKFISFLAGFIDGDGSIYSSHIKIDNHVSWISIHELIRDLFIKFYEFKQDDFTIKVDKHGYSGIDIRNVTNLSILKTDLMKLKLPLLDRKWCKIDENGLSKKDRNLNLNKTILSNIESGLTIPEMGVSMNASENTLRSYLHRKNIKYNNP
jgi:hypothetical protein